MEQDNGSLYVMWLKKLDLVIVQNTLSQKARKKWRTGKDFGDHVNLMFLKVRIIYDGR